MPAGDAIPLELIGFCAVVAALALFRRVHLPGRGLYLLRALLPSWRFFDDFGRAPVLWVRARDDGGTFGAWSRALQRRPRRLTHLLSNPEVNLQLLNGSLVQQLAREIAALEEPDPDRVTDSVAYTLTRRLARECALERGDCAAFQFKIRLESPLEAGGAVDVLVSPTYEV